MIGHLGKVGRDPRRLTRRLKTSGFGLTDFTKNRFFGTFSVLVSTIYLNDLSENRDIRLPDSRSLAQKAGCPASDKTK